MTMRTGALALLFPLSIAVPPTVRLRNGVEMPLIAAGTWQYNDTQAEESISAALKVGFTMIDTAYDYHNQAGVGLAIKKSGIDRSKIFVETKAPGCGFDGTSTDRCYNDTMKVIDTDLKLLNLTYVDLVQDQWRAMEDAYAAGKVKAIGVSNYCPSCFACLDGKAKVFPMVNQIGYHIGMGPDPSGFRSYADKNGMVLQAYSPLGNRPGGSGPDDGILKGKLTSSIAKAHGKSTIAVALKWLVQHGVPAVTKSSNPAHLADDLDLWSWNLTADEMADADKFHLFGMPSFACNFEESVVV